MFRSVRWSRSRRNRWILRGSIFLFLLSLSIFTIHRIGAACLPTAQEFAKADAVNFTTEVLNTALAEASYQDLVQLQTDTHGNVMSLTTDWPRINTLKSEISMAILQKYAGCGTRSTKLPLGSISKIPFLYGRGPSITIRALPADSVTAEVGSEFVSAGINQTLYRVVLTLQSEVRLLLPGGAVHNLTLQNKVCVSETLIVGQVPDLYPYGNLS